MRSPLEHRNDRSGTHHGWSRGVMTVALYHGRGGAPVHPRPPRQTRPGQGRPRPVGRRGL